MLLVCALVALRLLTVAAGGMEVLYSWNYIDLNFPSEALRESYLSSGKFIPKNNVILDVDVWQDVVGRKVLVTIPKFKSGIPVTLATVTDQRRNNTTLLEPYPDWSWHQGDCDGIISVYRISVDECNRLWVMDTGVVESFVEYKRICSPQILVFDLNTNQLIKRYRFPDEMLDPTTAMITIVVDIRDHDCECSVAYMADVNEFHLYVYDFARDKSWRITNNLFYPYPFHGDFHINGVDFELMDGIFGLALGPIRDNGDRTLYFHSLASVHESWVSTSVIRNSSLFEHNAGASPRAFHVFEDSRNSQVAAQAMTSSGVLFYTLAEENAIGCWNSHLPFKKQNWEIVAKDKQTLQFQSGIKIVGNQVWTVSNRLQIYIADEYSESEINIRINIGRIPDLVKNSKCDRQRPSNIVNFVFPKSQDTVHSRGCHSSRPRP